MTDPPSLDWETLNAQLTSVLAQAAFDQRTVKNTHHLVSVCRLRCTLPAYVAKGYWDTIRMSWPQWEVEVFPDRFELYHFQEARTDITYFAHEPGEPVAEALVEQLPAR